MASQERGLSLPVPGVGERLKKIVDALKNRGHHGIMQASVIAPEKPKTDVPSDLTQEELKQLIPPSPGSSKEPPKNKKPWIQRAIGNLGVRIGLGVLAAGGAGYAAREAISDNIPALSRPAETVAPFDNNLLDVKPQTIVLGLNAREATPEEIQNFTNAPLPEMKPANEIKTPADLPVISILPSIDLQKAGKVEIQRKSTSQYWGGEQLPVPINLLFSIENKDTPRGVTILEGINTDTVEVFLGKPLKTGGEIYTTLIYLKFRLDDGKYIMTTVVTEYNTPFKITDIIKDAPSIDPDRPNSNYIKDVLRETGSKVNLLNNPALYTTTVANSKINEVSWLLDSNNGKTAIVVPQSQNGNFLFSTPH